mgnify:CR=1 FL=1
MHRLINLLLTNKHQIHAHQPLDQTTADIQNNIVYLSFQNKYQLDKTIGERIFVSTTQ